MKNSQFTYFIISFIFHIEKDRKFRVTPFQVHLTINDSFSRKSIETLKPFSVRLFEILRVAPWCEHIFSVNFSEELTFSADFFL